MGYDDGTFLVPREVRGNNQNRRMLRGLFGVDSRVPFHIRILKRFGILNSQNFDTADFYYDGQNTNTNLALATTSKTTVLENPYTLLI